MWFGNLLFHCTVLLFGLWIYFVRKIVENLLFCGGMCKGGFGEHLLVWYWFDVGYSLVLLVLMLVLIVVLIVVLRVVLIDVGA